MRKLTKREQRTRRISRGKAAKRKFRRVKRACAALGMVGIIGLAGYGWWFESSGQLEITIDRTHHAFYAWTAEDLGLRVENIYLEGRDKTPLVEIEGVLAIKKDAPILEVSLDDLKDRLETLGWIREAVVDRSLPHTLHIQIFERQGVALWQYEGVLRLVDRDGVVIPDGEIAQYSHLPVVVGEDAPEHTYALLEFLGKEPSLFSQVSAAIRVGARRWNIRLYNGIEIKLPEENPGQAWTLLARLQEGDELLQRDIASVDLRLPERMYIGLTQAAITQRSTDAKKAAKMRSAADKET